MWQYYNSTVAHLQEDFGEPKIQPPESAAQIIVSANIELAQPLAQGVAVDAKHLRGLQLVAQCPLEGVTEQRRSNSASAA